MEFAERVGKHTAEGGQHSPTIFHRSIPALQCINGGNWWWHLTMNITVGRVVMRWSMQTVPSGDGVLCRDSGNGLQLDNGARKPSLSIPCRLHQHCGLSSHCCGTRRLLRKPLSLTIDPSDLAKIFPSQYYVLSPFPSSEW